MLGLDHLAFLPVVAATAPAWAPWLAGGFCRICTAR